MLLFHWTCGRRTRWVHICAAGVSRYGTMDMPRDVIAHNTLQAFPHPPRHPSTGLTLPRLPSLGYQFGLLTHISRHTNRRTGQLIVRVATAGTDAHCCSVAPAPHPHSYLRLHHYVLSTAITAADTLYLPGRHAARAIYRLTAVISRHCCATFPFEHGRFLGCSLG